MDFNAQRDMKINKWQFWDHSTMKIPRGNDEDIKNANVNLRNQIHKHHVIRRYKYTLFCDARWALFLQMERNSFCENLYHLKIFWGVEIQDSNFRFKCEIKNLCSPPHTHNSYASFSSTSRYNFCHIIFSYKFTITFFVAQIS